MDEIQKLSNLEPNMLSSQPFKFFYYWLRMTFVESLSIASLKIGIENLKPKTAFNEQRSKILEYHVCSLKEVMWFRVFLHEYLLIPPRQIYFRVMPGTGS
jgi:hypothetical protein